MSGKSDWEQNAENVLMSGRGKVDPEVIKAEVEQRSGEDCFAESLGTQGILLLAFDDRNFGDWEKALPIFRKYKAHATFFISGDFDMEAVETAKRLVAEGHSVGLHGYNHVNVPDMMAECGAEGWWEKEIREPKQRAEDAGIPIHSFGYPNNRHNEEADAYLLSRFKRVRVGIPGVRPYDPEGKLAKEDRASLVSDERLFFSVKELPKRRVLGGVILGDAYHTEMEEIVLCVRRAADRKEVILFTSHGISENATRIHAKTSWIEGILAEANKGGMLVLGFDELP